MREIKFRAWDKKGKKMIEIDNIEFTWKKGKFKGGKVLYVCSKEGYEFDCNNVILMQFTGLKDKNGKEIYEGDVLRYGNKEDDIIIQIVWIDLSDNGFKIIRQVNKNIIHDIRIYRFDEQAEVIGNIYKNPELLTKKTNKTKGGKKNGKV